MPALADKPVYFLAPIDLRRPGVPGLLGHPASGPTREPRSATARRCSSPTCPIGVLIVLACSALGVYGIVLAGWARGRRTRCSAALRSAAQMISYEVAMGLSLVAVFLYSGTLSTSGIVADRSTALLVRHRAAAVSFVIYAIAVVGETNRAPFDLPEAESELVGGFHTEYSR